MVWGLSIEWSFECPDTENLEPLPEEELEKGDFSAAPSSFFPFLFSPADSY